jgi:hypothetical protein
MRCHTGLRTSFWSCAWVIESTIEATADEPAHSETTKPTDTTSARPLLRMSFAVGAMISSTTSAVNTRRAKSMMVPSTSWTVSGPNQPPTKPSEPSSARNSGGSESACQNAACAECEKMSSSQALPRVSPSTRRTGPGPPPAGSDAVSAGRVSVIAPSG